jgi:hypothetical protein
MNKETYLHILRRLRDAAGRTNSWFLRHNYAPAYRSIVVKDFLAKNIVTAVERALYLLTCLQLVLTCFLD